MPDSERNVIPVTASRGLAAARPAGEYLLFRCLIVSADAERQEMFAEAAAEGGWDATICGDAQLARAFQSRNFVQLAIVDLESDSSGDLHELLEQLSQSSAGMLSIACGTQDDMEEEIWVRQVGAWLYLPGVDQTTQMGLLCAEARSIVERLHAAATAPQVRKAASRKVR